MTEEQNSADEKLQEAVQNADHYRRQLEVVCNNATLAIFITDEQQQCTFMNSAAEKLTGYSLAEVQGRALHDIIHHSHPDGTPYPIEACPIDRAFPQNNQEQGEEVFVHKDGHFYPVAYTASPIRDAGGISGTIIEVRDITLEKAAEKAREKLDRLREQAEAALRDREQFLQNLTNKVPISLWTARKDGALDYISQPWLDYTGMTFDPANQESWLEVIHPDDQALTVDRWAACIQSGESTYEITHRVRRADGVYRWCITCAVLTRDEWGNPLRWYGSSIDIEAQKQSEVALAESEERFRLATQAVDAMVFDWDLQVDRVYRSEKLFELIGIHPDDASPPSSWWFDRIHPDDAVRLQTLKLELLESADRYEGEYRVRHADGRWIDVWEQGCLIRNESGVVIRIVGSTKDISDRRQAEIALQEAYEELNVSNEELQATLEELQVTEEELRQQNDELAIVNRIAAAQSQRYQDLFNFAPDGYLVTDMHGKIQEANRAIASLLQRDQSQLIGEFVSLYVPPSDRPIFRSLLNLIAESPQQQRQTDELSLHSHGETPIPVAVTIAAVCDRQNQAIAVRWIIRDIRDRKIAEAVLRDREARLRLILESAQDYAIITLDLNGRITTWNAGAQRLLGYTEAEIIGQHGRIIFTPEDRAAGKPEEEMRAALTKGRGENERWHLRKDKSRFWGSGLVTPLRDAADNVQGFLKIMQDKTAERQAAQEREQMLEREQAAREQAETANRIKDEFLAVLSHELRTPLNPILGWSQLLRSGRLDATKTNQALEAIERNARLQTQLIEDLLDVSRILRGKLSLNMAAVNLTAPIESALDTVRLAAEAKSIAIEIHLEAIAPVLGDAMRLQQVVWNLLSNAIKFTPSGGRVEIRLEAIGNQQEEPTPDPRPPTPQARLTVSDTGIGISPDFLPYVFDYFRQADGATTRRFGGLGLGLAIVRNLVELHGGTVSADSQGENQGATFTVCLPLMQAQIEHQDEAADLLLPTDAAPLTGLKVLLVDDEADTRDVIAFTLEEAGAIVTSVGSAIEALQAFEQAKPDLLVSDIGMPDMDGYALIAQIRARLAAQNGQRTQAIALTAYAGELDQQRALAAGFQRHLAKPVEPDELIEAIVKLVRQ